MCAEGTLLCFHLGHTVYRIFMTSNPTPPPNRSMYNLFTTVPVPNHDPPGPSEEVHEAIPLTFESDHEDEVGMNMKASTGATCSSSATDESWTRGIFDERRQPTHPEGGGKPVSQGPPTAEPTGASSAEAAPTAYPEPESARAFGGGGGTVPVAPQAEASGLGVGFGFGPRVGSSAVSIGASGCYSSRSSRGTGPVEVSAGGSAPASGAAQPPPPPAPPTPWAPAAPPTTVSAGHVIHRAHEEGGGSAPLPLLSSVHSSSSPSPGIHATALPNNAAPGGTGGAELLGPSELEGPNSAGLLDAVNALLGEAVLEGFGEEGSSEEDLLQLFEGNA